jgi:hypothetical protein
VLASGEGSGGWDGVQVDFNSAVDRTRPTLSRVCPTTYRGPWDRPSGTLLELGPRMRKASRLTGFIKTMSVADRATAYELL